MEDAPVARAQLEGREEGRGRERTGGRRRGTGHGRCRKCTCGSRGRAASWVTKSRSARPKPLPWMTQRNTRHSKQAVGPTVSSEGLTLFFGYGRQKTEPRAISSAELVMLRTESCRAVEWFRACPAATRLLGRRAGVGVRHERRDVQAKGRDHLDVEVALLRRNKTDVGQSALWASVWRVWRSPSNVVGRGLSLMTYPKLS